MIGNYGKVAPTMTDWSHDNVIVVGVRGEEGEKKLM